MAYRRYASTRKRTKLADDALMSDALESGNTYFIFIDGSFHEKSPNFGTGGVVVREGADILTSHVKTEWFTIHSDTFDPSHAELRTILWAIQQVIVRKWWQPQDRILMYCDSPFLVDFLTQKETHTPSPYAVEHLAHLVAAVQAQAQAHRVTFHYVMRDFNMRAHGLAQRALVQLLRNDSNKPDKVVRPPCMDEREFGKQFWSLIKEQASDEDTAALYERPMDLLAALNYTRYEARASMAKGALPQQTANQRLRRIKDLIDHLMPSEDAVQAEGRQIQRPESTPGYLLQKTLEESPLDFLAVLRQIVAGGFTVTFEPTADDAITWSCVSSNNGNEHYSGIITGRHLSQAA